MPAYDREGFDPPAPVARVRVRGLNSPLPCCDALLLVDSGADVTLLPQSVSASLGVSIESAPRHELAGFDGTLSHAPALLLEVIFCGRSYRGQFLLIEQPIGILGRNVLNTLSIRLDGPRLWWDES